MSEMAPVSERVTVSERMTVSEGMTVGGESERGSVSRSEGR